MSLSTWVRAMALAATAAAGLAGAAWAQQDQATAEEVVDKVRQAAQYLAEAGEAGLDVFRRQASEYVWKDSYVVVQDCEAGTVVAHPIRSDLEGSDLDAISDETGKAFAQELCQAAAQPQGGWVEYRWPKPGEQAPSRKLSYAASVAGTPYMVTAGVYDEDATIEELERLSSGAL